MGPYRPLYTQARLASGPCVDWPVPKIREMAATSMAENGCTKPCSAEYVIAMCIQPGGIVYCEYAVNDESCGQV